MRKIFLKKNLIQSLFTLGEIPEALILLKNFKSYDKNLKLNFFERSVTIPKNFVGKRIFFNTGKGISSIKISSYMIGLKLGEFGLVGSQKIKKILKNKKKKK